MYFFDSNSPVVDQWVPFFETEPDLTRLLSVIAIKQTQWSLELCRKYPVGKSRSARFWVVGTHWMPSHETGRTLFLSI